MNIAVKVTIFTHSDSTEVMVDIGSEYGNVRRLTTRDPDEAVHHIEQIIRDKFAEGLVEVQKKRSALVAQLAKAQQTLEREGAGG